MSIQVKFFASLRERLNCSDKTLNAATVQTVQDVWQQSTGLTDILPNTLAARNMEYVEYDAPVVDGDEVAFFPPVTGG